VEFGKRNDKYIGELGDDMRDFKMVMKKWR